MNLKQERLHYTAEPCRCGETRDASYARKYKTLPDYMKNYVSLGSAKSHAQAELARAPADDVSDQTIDSYRSDEHCEHTKAEQENSQCAWRLSLLARAIRGAN